MQIVCKNCGHQYSDGILVTNSTNVTFSNNYAQCPYCGTMNKGKEGTFDFDSNGNIVRDYLAELNLTANELTQLRVLLQESLVGTTPNTQQLSEQVSTINPKLKGLFNLTPLTNTDIIGIITAILAALTLLLNLKNDQPTTVNNVTNNITNNYTVPEESYGKTMEREMRAKALEEIRKKKEAKSVKKRRVSNN
jgi:hypothetical protein